MNKIAVGIDIGGTRTKAGLVDLHTGEVLHSAVFPTETKSPEIFHVGIDSAIQSIQQVADKNQIKIEGIGFGVPSFVFKNGIVDSTYGFLEFMEDYPLVEMVERKFNLPCRVDNDARIVALGEALFGIGKGFDRMLMLTLGTGLGLGFTVNGQLPESLPYAHMGGHITIADNDVKCYCGKTGCLESLVSGTGLVETAKREPLQSEDKSIEDAESIFKLAHQKNALARSIVDQWLKHLKTGIDNYINIYAPDMIVLGGGVANALKNDLPFLEDTNLLRPFKKYSVKIAISTLNERAGILGSAALFLQ